MTLRQQFLKLFYPLLVKAGNRMGIKNGIWRNSKNIKPAMSFFDLHSTLNNGEAIHFGKLKGKKILIVNTASDCGYTSQYSELQKLQESYPEKLIVIGFPANDFKEQEQKSDAEIQQFCQLNYGVQFPLMKKSIVTKGDGQNQVFDWITNADKNGWNDHGPKWNFYKYLIDEQGALTHVFASGVSPMSKEVISEVIL